MSRSVECVVCGREFVSGATARKDTRFCSAKCRQRSHRGTEMAEEIGTGLVKAVRTELAGLGKMDSLLGQQALAVAQRLTRTSDDTGSAVASLSRELSRLMGQLGAKGEAADPVDEMRRRREQKRARAASG